MSSSITTSVSAGIPLLVDASVSISHSLSYGYTNTKETGEAVKDSYTVSTTIPPRTRLTVKCVYHKTHMNIPYTISLKSASHGRLS